MLTSLSTCSRHACFVTVRVWVGGGVVNASVNLLMPCMLRDTQGLGGGTPVSACSRRACLVTVRVWEGVGVVNVIVNLLMPCIYAS